MTAILACTHIGAPLLMADVIESISRGYAPTTVYVPSVGEFEASSTTDPRYQVSGLIQKVSVIGPNLAIAWCGKVASARNLLKRLWDYNRVEPFDYHALVKLVDGDSPSIQRGDIALIALVRDGTGWRLFERNIRHKEQYGRETIWADGTGADVLAAQVKEFRGNTSAATPAHHAISLGIAMSGSLIDHEVHHLTSLKELYGGAYEVVSLVKGACTKVEDVLHIQWYGEMGASAFRLHTLARAYRYTYWSDMLVARTIRFGAMQGKQSQNDDSYTVIPPVFLDIRAEDAARAPVPSLEAPIVAHHITFRALDQEIYTVTRTDFGGTKGFRVRETKLPNSKHRIDIEIDTEFVRETSAQLRGSISALPKVN